jgi:microcystin-dependent protein
MSYTVPFSDPAKSNNPITVNDLTENITSTSLSLPGRNFSNYGTSIAKNFVHLLENFASPSSPNNSIEGQLWYDTSKKRLFINDSTAGSSNWRPAGGTHVSPTSIPPQNPLLGDLWVNSLTQQLSLYNGNSWILVGPSALAGRKSGVYVEQIVDAESNESKFVSVEYVNDLPIKITSSDSFIPQRAILGFTKINAGVNLSERRFVGPGDGGVENTPAKLYGVATSADALNVTSPNFSRVQADNFARKDIGNTYFGQQTILNNAGITIGSSSNFNLSVNQGTAVIRNSSDGGSIDFIVPRQGAQNLILKIDGQNRRVGINKPNPISALDVEGSAIVSGTLTVGVVSNNPNQPNTLQINGDSNIFRNLQVGKNIIANGHISLGELSADGTPVPGPAVIPNRNLLYDIGTPSLRFKTVYAENFNGQFNGILGSTANPAEVVGNIQGSASRLASSTEFTITGDVETVTGVSTDGDGTPVSLSTRISDNFLKNRTEVVDNRIDDELLIFRQNVGLRRVNRTNFLLGEAFIPIGTIFPFAGVQVPIGYLLCDGSLVPRTSYPFLFQVIGTTYGGIANGTYFRVPDLRGRFAMGNVGMLNSLQNIVRNKSLLLPSNNSNQITINNTDDVVVGMRVTTNEGNIPDNTFVTSISDLTLTLSNSVTVPATAVITFLLRLVRDDIPVNDETRISNVVGDNSPGLLGGTGGVSSRSLNTVTSGSNPQTTNTGSSQSVNTNFNINVVNPYISLNYIIRAGVPAVQQ